MKYVKNYECTLCHKIYDKSEDIFTCTDCGESGILDINFNYDLLKQDIGKEYFKNNHDYSMWRYTPFMTVEDTHLMKSLKVGWTPLYEAFNIQADLGVPKLYIKDEGVNPTSSLKDRASAVAVMKAIEHHHDVISCSSTGNAASSLACHAARMGLKTVIFVPKRAPIGKLNQLLIYGSDVISVDGDYKDTFNLKKTLPLSYGINQAK